MVTPYWMNKKEKVSWDQYSSPCFLIRVVTCCLMLPKPYLSCCQGLSVKISPSYLNFASYPMMGKIRNIREFVGFRFPKHHWVFVHWFNSRWSLPSHKSWKCTLLLEYGRDNLVACIYWMGGHRLLTEGGHCISRKQNKMMWLDFRCRLTNTFLAQCTFSLNFYLNSSVIKTQYFYLLFSPI